MTPNMQYLLIGCLTIGLFISFLTGWCLAGYVHKGNPPRSIPLDNTPCKKLEQYFLEHYGKFPVNKVWQLDIKIRKHIPLTEEETFLSVFV